MSSYRSVWIGFLSHSLGVPAGALPAQHVFFAAFSFALIFLANSEPVLLASSFSSTIGTGLAQDSNDTQSLVRTVQGQIVGDDGKPVAGCTAEVFMFGDGKLGAASIDENGQFLFPFDSTVRSLMIRAISPDKTLQAIQRRDIRESEESIEPMRLQLEPTLSTRVTVHHLGKPAPDVFVAGLVGYGAPMIQGKADANGEVTLLNPVSFPLESIWVFDKSRGVAFWYPTVRADTVEKARENQPDEITVDLLPTRSCAVKVVDMDGNPVSGVEIFPYFRVEEDSNRKFFPPLPDVNAKTSENGIAKFDWMPAEPTNWFIPSLVSKEYRQVQDHFSREDIRAPRKTLKVRLHPKKYPARGRLVGPKNANFKGVRVFGDGASTDAGMFRSICDEHGNFVFDAIPDTTYSLAVMHRDWASDMVTGILLNQGGEQINELNISVYPATNVMASVTRGTDRTPVVRDDIMVEQTLSVPSEGPDKGDFQTVNTIRDYYLLKDGGQINIGLGRGKWRLLARSGKWQEEKEIEIGDAVPIDLVFHSDWMGENSIQGRVALPADAKTKLDPGSIAVEVFDVNFRGQTFETTADADGNWKLDADVQATFAALAWSGDKKLGMLKIVHAPDELPVTIELAPTTAISGKLLDDSGYPVANREVVLVHELGPRSQVRFGSTKTNDDGEFIIDGVITGLPLKVAVMRDSLNHTVVVESAVYRPGEPLEGLRLILIEDR